MENCMLARTYSGQNPIHYWLSEKLDGVRAIWNGDSFVSRKNKPINAPFWFKHKLPNKPLDGELFLSRGMFQKTVSIVRKKVPNEGEWLSIEYRIIDSPTESFTVFDTDKSLNWIPQIRCAGQAHLDDYYKSVLEGGGEGLMLREFSSPYEFKRSNYLLKLKPELESEALVIDHQSGEGKHLGRLGALICSWQGKEFKIGTGFTDAERENPPKIDSIVKFKYQCLTDAGIPRFPSF